MCRGAAASRKESCYIMSEGRSSQGINTLSCVTMKACVPPTGRPRQEELRAQSKFKSSSHNLVSHDLEKSNGVREMAQLAKVLSAKLGGLSLISRIHML